MITELLKWPYVIVAVIFLVSTALIIRNFSSHSRKHRHRQKRNRRLIRSILLPLSVPLKHEDCIRPHDRPIPDTAYKRFYLKTFFKATDIMLERREPCLFYSLRKNVYGIDETEYRSQFQKNTLEGGGNLGFSGATFFFTPGRKYIVKSLPNEFEWRFFYDELLLKYCDYMQQHKDSLLARITDALFNFDLRFWNLLRLGTASHFLVMQNMLEGLDETKGQQWDLKPQGYLRADLLVPTSEEEKERLLFKKGGLKLTQGQFENLIEILTRDTKFLAERRIVDYSLLIGRFPSEIEVPEPQNFRTGVRSADGKHVYRIGVIDYFFSHITVPSVIQNAGDLIPGDTEFTFTDEPHKYRKNFLDMAREYVTVQNAPKL